MNKLKEYWMLFAGAIGAILAILFFSKKNTDVDLIKRAQEAELKVVDTKLESVAEKRSEVEKQEAPKVADANPNQVNDFWNDELKKDKLQ